MNRVITIMCIVAVVLSGCGNGSGGEEPQFVDSNNTKIRDGRYGPIADSTWSGQDNAGDTTAK